MQGKHRERQQYTIQWIDIYSHTEVEEIYFLNEQSTKIDGQMLIKYDNETEYRK